MSSGCDGEQFQQWPQCEGISSLGWMPRALRVTILTETHAFPSRLFTATWLTLPPDLENLDTPFIVSAISFICPQLMLLSPGGSRNMGITILRFALGSSCGHDWIHSHIECKLLCPSHLPFQVPELLTYYLCSHLSILQIHIIRAHDFPSSKGSFAFLANSAPLWFWTLLATPCLWNVSSIDSGDFTPLGFGQVI